MSKRTEKCIVLDASVVVDLFAGRGRDRVDVAEKFSNALKIVANRSEYTPQDYSWQRLLGFWLDLYQKIL